eukprot:5604524-Prymnesium_polylepis.2
MRLWRALHRLARSSSTRAADNSRSHLKRPQLSLIASSTPKKRAKLLQSIESANGSCSGPSSEMTTGIQPPAIESNRWRVVGVSPRGTRQKLLSRTPRASSLTETSTWWGSFT